MTGGFWGQVRAAPAYGDWVWVWFGPNPPDYKAFTEAKREAQEKEETSD